MVESKNEDLNLLKGKEFFRETYIDYEKIKDCCYGNYKLILEENKKMENFCSPKHFDHVMTKKDFFESKNTKELCRQGIPYMHTRDFFLKMFSAQNELEESFNLKMDKVFKGRDKSKLGDYVPYLTGYKNLKDSLPVDFLNEKGLQSVKEIQWMLNSVIPTMEYTPILIKINMLLHLFHSQAEVYFILRNLININYSLKETYKIRWHMRFNFEDNNKVISSMSECIKDLGGKDEVKCIEFFESSGVGAKYVFEQIIFDFFTGYLIFPAIIRLLGFFFREGTKALYRSIHAFLVMCGPKILEIKTTNKKEFMDEIKKIGLEINDLGKFFEIAYDYNLTRNNNKYDFQPVPEGDEFSNRRTSYNLPYLYFPNNLKQSILILDESTLIKLWQIFPLDIKIRNCYLTYSTYIHGFSLRSLYAVGEKSLEENFNQAYDYYTLFIIETQKDEIFGGIMSRLLVSTNNKSERPQYVALFRHINNKFEYYPIKESNQLDTIHGEDKNFLFGLGDKGAAIRLDDDLNHGFSNACSNFGSPPLTQGDDGEYSIKNLEVYNLS